MRLWYLSHKRPAKAQAHLRSLTRAFTVRRHDVDEGSDQNTDLLLHRMAVHAYLRNEFTVGKKYHSLMTWLKWTLELCGKLHFLCFK